jgi:hypothetical protein
VTRAVSRRVHRPEEHYRRSRSGIDKCSGALAEHGTALSIA